VEKSKIFATMPIGYAPAWVKCSKIGNFSENFKNFYIWTFAMTPDQLLMLVVLLIPGILLSALVMGSFAKGG